jgi:hypothetical protein
MGKRKLSVEHLIKNRDFGSIDPTRLTNEHLEDIADAINQQVNHCEESYLQEGSAYHEYVSSYNYGEGAPNFDSIENAVLANYLKKSFDQYPEETHKLMDPYSTIEVGDDVYTSENAIVGSYLHNSEVEVSLQDQCLEDLEELFFKLSEKQQEYLKDHVQSYVKVTRSESILFYTTVTGKIEIILKVDDLIEDMVNLDDALRLTDSNPVIRNFPVKELLEE